MLTPIPSSMWCDTQSALYHLRINAKLREVAKQWDFWCRGQESGTPWIMLADQDNMAVLLGLLLFWYCIDLRTSLEGRFNLLAKESFISLIRSKVPLCRQRVFGATSWRRTPLIRPAQHSETNGGFGIRKVIPFESLRIFQARSLESCVTRNP